MGTGSEQTGKHNTATGAGRSGQGRTHGSLESRPVHCSQTPENAGTVGVTDQNLSPPIHMLKPNPGVMSGGRALGATGSREASRNK